MGYRWGHAQLSIPHRTAPHWDEIEYCTTNISVSAVQGFSWYGAVQGFSKCLDWQHG